MGVGGGGRWEYVEEESGGRWRREVGVGIGGRLRWVGSLFCFFF